MMGTVDKIITTIVDNYTYALAEIPLVAMMSIFKS